MFAFHRSFGLAALMLIVGVFPGRADDGPLKKRIVLVAGETAKVDVAGHHDYLAGCRCLDILLRQTGGIETARVNGGWPENKQAFDGASAVVFYTDGGGKQAFLDAPDRIATMQSLAEAGVGMVMIHQAVDFPDEFATQGQAWLGGVYLAGKSGRGHWPSVHIEFPTHPITRGVSTWKVNDGWLNGLQFVDKMQGITPLVWSGKDDEESRAGQDAQIVGWAYQRPDGGRSFSFTGLDAHSAWELDGMRQLVVNGILWSAGVEIPARGAPCRIEKSELQSLLTPREPKPPAKPTAKKP